MSPDSEQDSRHPGNTRDALEPAYDRRRGHRGTARRKGSSSAALAARRDEPPRLDARTLKHAEDVLAFLTTTTRVLFSSADYPTTLGRIAELTIPRLADYCQIDLVGADGRALECIAAAHRDPARLEAVRSLCGAAPVPGAAEVVRTGAPRLEPVVVPADYDRLDGTTAGGRMLELLGVRSLLIVPLNARGHRLGAISLIATEAAQYTPETLPLVDELAHRVAITVEAARLYEAERQARAAAESASRAKSDFLALMSHELRTPLNAIIGYTDLVLEGIVGPVSERQSTYLTRVRESAQHLLALIDEVLSVSNIETTRAAVGLEPVDVSLIARQVAAAVAPQAAAKQLRIEVQGIDSYLVPVDGIRVRQILLNLLSNAIKFTARGTVTLTVGLDDGPVLRYDVRDTGSGIRPEHRERIFEPFWQVEQSPARRPGGVGLGLSIARQLARQLGGDVTVESVPGEWSCFTLAIPLPAASKPASP
jgi:signal transduction histidine kinase